MFAPSLGTWLQKFMETLIFLPQIKKQEVTKEEEKEEGEGKKQRKRKRR